MALSPGGVPGLYGPPVTRGMPLNLPQAPAFRPTAEEFQDPLAYIASIQPIAEPFGICRVVPPEGWKPPFALDKDSFKFPTRVQCVHALQHRAHQAAQSSFFDGYFTFLGNQGKNTKKLKAPVYCGQDIDLFRMYRAVQRRGGYQKVTEERLWKDVAKILKVSRPCLPPEASCLGVVHRPVTPLLLLRQRMDPLSTSVCVSR